jgi:hypothetical protein
VCYFFDRDSEPRILFTLSTHAAGFVKVGAHLFVACTDETMHIYDDAGRIKHIRRLRGRPLAICELDVKDKGITGVLVSTSESVIQIFRYKSEFNQFEKKGPISCFLEFREKWLSEAELKTRIRALIRKY